MNRTKLVKTKVSYKTNCYRHCVPNHRRGVRAFVLFCYCTTPLSQALDNVITFFLWFFPLTLNKTKPHTNKRIEAQTATKHRHHHQPTSLQPLLKSVSKMESSLCGRPVVNVVPVPSTLFTFSVDPLPRMMLAKVQRLSGYYPRALKADHPPRTVGEKCRCRRPERRPNHPSIPSHPISGSVNFVVKIQNCKRSGV